MTLRNLKVNYRLSIFFFFEGTDYWVYKLLKFSQHHSSLTTICESSKCLIYALHVVRLWVNASTALPAMSATDGSIECVGQVIFFFIIHSFISAHLCIHNYFLSCRILTKF